jgi:hypothetical protein
VTGSVEEADIDQRPAHPKLRSSGLGGLQLWARKREPWPALALVALALSVVVTASLGYEGRPDETPGVLAAACAAGLFAALALFLSLRSDRLRVVYVGATWVGVVGLTLLANAPKISAALEARQAQSLLLNARNPQDIEAVAVDNPANRAVQTYNALFHAMSATAEGIAKVQAEIEPPLVKQALGPKYDITTIATSPPALQQLRGAFQTALQNNRAADQKLDQIFAEERAALEASARTLGSAEVAVRNLSAALAAMREPESDLLRRVGRARGDRYGAFNAAIDTLITHQSAVRVNGGQLIFQSREAVTSWNVAKRNLSAAEENMKRLEAEWLEMERSRVGALEKVLARR